MSKLKLAGPALLFVGFLLPCFAQDAPASRFAKQVEHDIAALSSQPSVGAWQKLHPDEKLELMHYDDGNDHDEANLGMDFFSWCAASSSGSPSIFGRVAYFFVPNVKAGELPPLPSPGHASIKESCRMQALHYSVVSEIPIQDLVRDLVREFSSVWGTPDRSQARSGKEFGRPENIYGDFAIWDHDGVSARLAFRWSDIPFAGHQVPVGIVLYAKLDALPTAPCADCTSSLMYPLYSEGLTLFLQEAAQIAAEDPALARQIVEWSHQRNNPKWTVDPTLARNNLSKWLEVARQRPPHQRAAALLLADLYVTGTKLDPEIYKGLGAEYDKQGNYLNNFMKQAEKMDQGGEVSELVALLSVSGECPGFDKRPWPDLATEHVESFRARFPSDQWTPYVHFALAIAHSAKLLWTYPGGGTDDYSTEGSPLSPAAKEHERAAAIEHFKAFLDARPEGPEAAFAWLEAWRLLAGLPPNKIGWGCTGE
jgi:hypothetical protein